MDPAISEICRRVRITDYLLSKGIELSKSGRNMRCKCPLHAGDNDPSFYVRTMEDGTQLFKCFGCNEGGTVITLMHLMDKERKGTIIKRLSRESGIKLAAFDEATRVEPLPHEIMEIFCQEDDLAAEIGEVGLKFMHFHKTPDAVNKVSRLYEMVDRMADLGDADQIRNAYNKLNDIIEAYQ
jgi:hypothetical protein